MKNPYKMNAAEWESQAKAVFADFDKNKEKIYKYAPWKRVGGKIATPVCCLPCFLWSLICRILACPCQCCIHGAAMACSNNGCTNMTDQCFAASWTAYDEIYKLPKMPDGISKEFLLEIDNTIEKYDFSKSYALCEMLFANTMESATPYNVKDYLKKY